MIPVEMSREQFATVPQGLLAHGATMSAGDSGLIQGHNVTATFTYLSDDGPGGRMEITVTNHPWYHLPKPLESAIANNIRSVIAAPAGSVMIGAAQGAGGLGLGAKYTGSKTAA